MQSEAEGDARADGVETYSEVSARPDNEAMRRPTQAPRGAETDARRGAPEREGEGVLGVRRGHLRGEQAKRHIVRFRAAIPQG